MQGSPWTEEDYKKLKKLAKKELTADKIAKKLNRTTKAIRTQAWKNNIEIKKKKELPFEPYNKKGKRFVRETNTWEVSNRILYGILLIEDIKLAELAELVGVSARTVQRWVYEGTKPNQENKEKLSKILNILSKILFSDYAYKKAKKI